MQNIDDRFRFSWKLV